MTPEGTSAAADFLLSCLEAAESRHDRRRWLPLLEGAGRRGRGRAGSRGLGGCRAGGGFRSPGHFEGAGGCPPLLAAAGSRLRRGLFGPERAARSGALFDADAGRSHVAGDLGRALEDYRFAPANLSDDGAADGDACAGDVTTDARLLAQRDVARDEDVAVDAPVNFDRSVSAYVAADDGALTNHGTFGH
jgi:hypothetical protein